jgi:hypothetical protein
MKMQGLFQSRPCKMGSINGLPLRISVCTLIYSAFPDPEADSYYARIPNPRPILPIKQKMTLEWT